MSVVMIPRERDITPMIEWLEANIAAGASPRQPYVRQYGPGWDVRTYAEPGGWGSCHWKFTIGDDEKAVIFSLRWL